MNQTDLDRQYAEAAEFDEWMRLMSQIERGMAEPWNPHVNHQPGDCDDCDEANVDEMTELRKAALSNGQP